MIAPDERRSPERTDDVVTDVLLKEAARLCRRHGRSPGELAEMFFAHAAVTRRNGWPQLSRAYQSKLCELAPALSWHARNLAQVDTADEGLLEGLRRAAWLLCETGAEEHVAEVHLCLGRALAQRQRRDEAREAYGRALSLEPQSLRALMGLAELAMECGQASAAVQQYRRAIDVRATYSRAHRGLGDALKATGDWPEGFQEDEWHRSPTGKCWRDFEQPAWTRTMQHGKTVLMWSNNALGDAIQALRYLPLVKAYGGRLIVEANSALVPLIRSMPDVDEAISFDGVLPAFDVHERFTRLPLVFRTTSDAVPGSVPYLFPEKRFVERWAQRLKPDERLTVGLCWGGNKAHASGAVRFTTLQEFAPLGRSSGVRFIALQLLPQSVETIAPPMGLSMECLLDNSCSTADTAALMHHLDLVITVDTMVAHLAGAVARPVWVALPRSAEWRWSSEGERSRWYPTMRLFRQVREGDWTEVFGRVGSALDELIETRRGQR